MAVVVGVVTRTLRMMELGMMLSLRMRMMVMRPGSPLCLLKPGMQQQRHLRRCQVSRSETSPLCMRRS